jgi:hypothetical protein
VAERWFDGHATSLEHWMGPKTFLRTSYYQEVLRPHGIRDVAAVFFSLDMTVPAGLEFVQLFRTKQDRPFRRDEVDSLMRLVPHLLSRASP